MIRSKPLALALSLALAALPLVPAPARADGGFAGGLKCVGPVTFNNSLTINKNVSINKPVTIDKSISIYNPVTINKSISIDKSVNIIKNIDSSKKISINKKIIINKGKGDATAEAFAFALARASSRSNAIVYGGGYVDQAVSYGGGGDIGALAVEEPCIEQWATLVRAVHAVCVDVRGRSHPAARMRPETWIDASYSGEVYRCLEGSSLRVRIGHVVESEKGMAAVYEGADELACRPGEALRHYADGLVKCATAERVPECAERRNLRAWGAGDIFFSYQTRVCARSYVASYQAKKMSYGASRELELTGMSLNGGVGY
ncbi:MAG: hypothetical protein ACT4OG_01415 [Alphaproteobacteria bacterium]